MIQRTDTVLLTGAGGDIGKAFTEAWLRNHRDDYHLRPAYRRESSIDSRLDHAVVVDIEDRDAVLRACRDVHTVVHLAANADWQADFCDALAGPNIMGAFNVFDAAREAGVRRLVYASSVHAIMGYPVDFQAHANDPARPDTMYGVTKVFGEALCSSFAYEHGMSCIAVRIGAFVSDGDHAKVRDSDNPQLLDIVVSERDLTQLLHRCIVAPDDVDYAVVHALSDNRFKRMDIESTKRLLDYAPQDDAFAWSREVELGEEAKV
jgi:uronate dehydrogenase